MGAENPNEEAGKISHLPNGERVSDFLHAYSGAFGFQLNTEQESVVMALSEKLDK